MARADTVTLLPIDSFAKILGVHPLHFNGVEVQDLAPVTTCGQPLSQFAWQTANSISREDVATAVADAEDRIAQYTRFLLAPKFIVDERREWPHAHAPERTNMFVWPGGSQSMTATPWWRRGPGVSIKTDWGHIISGGIEGKTLLQASAPVVYTDTDSDTYKETATIAVTTDIVDPNEIRAYYPGESAAAEWEIRPIKVAFGAGVATITIRREQLVNAGLFEGFDGHSIDGLDDAKFLATVDVYRVFHDVSQQVQLLWESEPLLCACFQPTCQSCFINTQAGCMTVRDYRTGLVSPQAADWNGATFDTAVFSVNRMPDKVRMWYRAGYRDQSARRPFLDMKPAWARAVVYFATALLNRPMCACQSLSAQMEYWQDDLAKIQINQSTTENYNIDRKSLDNPFGTTRGALYAWRVFRREQIGEAVLV